jgi:hypothetical protein
MSIGGKDVQISSFDRTLVIDYQLNVEDFDFFCKCKRVGSNYKKIKDRD